MSKNYGNRGMSLDNEVTVAQMAAFFLFQAKNKTMSHLKLMKLLYLADREMIAQHGSSMSKDCPVAMPHGPVLSQTLDLMVGNLGSKQHGWAAWISDKANHEVSLKQHKTKNSQAFKALLDHISPAAWDVLEKTWKKFGSMDQWEIVNWTHDNCKEWSDPNGSSHPILFKDIAQAVGFEEEAAEAIASDIEAMQKIDRTFH